MEKIEKIEKLNSIRVGSYETLFKNFFHKYKNKLIDSTVFLGDISLKKEMPCNIYMFLESVPINSFIFNLEDRYLNVGIFLSWMANNKDDFKSAKENHIENFMDTFSEVKDDFKISNLSKNKKKKNSNNYYPHCSLKINNVIRIINYGENGFFIQSNRNFSLLCLLKKTYTNVKAKKFKSVLNDYVDSQMSSNENFPLPNTYDDDYNGIEDESCDRHEPFFIKDIINVDYMEEIWQIKELDIYNYSDLLNMNNENDKKDKKETNYGQRSNIELLF